MVRVQFVLAFLAAAFPAACLAQNAPDGAMPPPSPSAQMIQAHAALKTAAFNDLSSDHRTKVQAIADGFNSGTIGRDDAIAQIDAVLSPAEKRAVLDEARKFHDQMRKEHPDMMGGPPPPGAPAPPGGAPPPGAPAPPNGPPGAMHGPPDAGHFLLAISASRERLREVMGAPPPQ